MATNVNTLITEFRKLMDPSYAGFIGFPATASAAAANWANAYDTYASQAVDPSGSGILTKNKVGFQAACTFVGGAADGNALATQLTNAFVAYWTGATFSLGAPFSTSGNVGGNGIFSSETTAAVTAIVPASLLAALQTEFAIKSGDGNAKAIALANILHNARSTVTVVITGLDTTPSPSGPLPISKTGNPS